MSDLNISYQDVTSRMRATCRHCGIKPFVKRLYISEQGDRFITSFALCVACGVKWLGDLSRNTHKKAEEYQQLSNKLAIDLMNRTGSEP